MELEQQQCIDGLLEAIGEACRLSVPVQAAIASCREAGVSEVLAVVDLRSAGITQLIEAPETERDGEAAPESDADFLRGLRIVPDISSEPAS